jgi:hypothetical protein
MMKLDVYVLASIMQHGILAEGDHLLVINKESELFFRTP